jgi:AmmeMemoRadiSam system protein B
LNLEYIILSQPLRRLQNPKELIPESIDLGRNLKYFFKSIEKRVVIIISADLGHTHEADGPYGFSKEAEVFDNMIQDWALSLDSAILTNKVIPFLDKAMCCGLIGFSLLQGMIEKEGFTPNLLIRETPTYYGMMVVIYDT